MIQVPAKSRAASLRSIPIDRHSAVGSPSLNRRKDAARKTTTAVAPSPSMSATLSAMRCRRIMEVLRSPPESPRECPLRVLRNSRARDGMVQLFEPPDAHICGAGWWRV